MNNRRRWEIRESLWVSLLLAILCGLAALFFLPAVLMLAIDTLWRCLVGHPPSVERTQDVALVVSVVSAFFVGRLVFVWLHWQAAPAAGRFCATCGYDLTGNMSGVCPECGAVVPGQRMEVDALPPQRHKE